ncbi:transmembrane adaptor Erv26, partial [Globomyces pollinis-pini]
MLMLHLLTYFTMLLAIIFLSYSLATGLYYLSELIEEYTIFTKKILNYSIVIIILFHLILLLDGFPILRLLFSIFCTLWYSRLLPKFPVVDLTGPIFVVSCVLALINHFLWLDFFRSNRYRMLDMISFFCLLVWLLPFLFIISTSANDLALPAFDSNGSIKNQSLVKKWLQVLLGKKDDD